MNVIYINSREEISNRYYRYHQNFLLRVENYININLLNWKITPKYKYTVNKTKWNDVIQVANYMKHDIWTSFKVYLLNHVKFLSNIYIQCVNSWLLNPKRKLILYIRESNWWISWAQDMKWSYTRTSFKVYGVKLYQLI